MFKKLTQITALIAVVTLPTLAQADEVFSCTGHNSALHFVIYENGDTPRGGHMYLNGLQTAVLNPYRMNSITIRARIAGNTAGTELILNKSRKAAYVTLNGTTNKLCDIRYSE